MSAWIEEPSPNDEDLRQSGVEEYTDICGEKHLKTSDGYIGWPECPQDRQNLFEHQQSINPK